jgi:hypothetical protein
MPTPLGQLLKDAFRTCVDRWQAVAVGIVLFGTITAIVATVMNTKIESQIWSSMQNVGFNQQQMQQLQQRLRSGDEGAVEDALQEIGTLGSQLEGMTEEERNAFFTREGRMMLRAMFPVLGAGAFGWFAITLFSGAYFLRLGLSKGRDPMEILSGVPRLVLPLAGVWIWAFLRSFAWIPIIGIIPAVILGPRFVLAPVILVREGKGVRACVQESSVRTRGYWGKVFGNLIAVWLVLLLLSWVLGIVTIPLARYSFVMGAWFQSVVQQLMLGYGTVFLIGLSTTIAEHPVKELR